MPKLIKLYITHSAIGFGLSAVFVALLMWFDVMNLRHLVLNAQGGWLALLVLWLSNGVVFAGVQFGIAVMRMAGSDDDEPRGGRRQMIPIRVEADGPRDVFKARKRH